MFPVRSWRRESPSRRSFQHISGAIQAGPRHQPGDSSNGSRGGHQHPLLTASAQPKAGERPPGAFELGPPLCRASEAPSPAPACPPGLCPLVGPAHRQRRRSGQIQSWVLLLLNLRMEEGPWRRHHLDLSRHEDSSFILAVHKVHSHRDPWEPFKATVCPFMIHSWVHQVIEDP